MLASLGHMIVSTLSLKSKSQVRSSCDVPGSEPACEIEYIRPAPLSCCCYMMASCKCKPGIMALNLEDDSIPLTENTAPVSAPLPNSLVMA